jgi:serine O-acetyltransferase
MSDWQHLMDTWRHPPRAGDAHLTPPAPLDLAAVVAELRDVRERWRASQQRPREISGRELPSRETLARIVAGLRGALFPMRLGPPDLRQDHEDYFVGHTLDTVLGALLGQVRLELAWQARLGLRGAPGEPPAAPPDAPVVPPDAMDVAVVRDFSAALPAIREALDSDVLAAFHGDPAARSVDDVLLCYPGVQAMIHHRLAHHLHRLGAPLLARIVAELAHAETGIDIHPGAQIGPGFFIDHGTGVVIGETAEIGRNVRLYQAVTLGAKRFSADEHGHLHKGGQRHPIVEDDVVIYAGATILGRVTIGRGSTIGGNVWLTRSVPPDSRISQAQTREDWRDDAVPDAARARP